MRLGRLFLLASFVAILVAACGGHGVITPSENPALNNVSSLPRTQMSGRVPALSIKSALGVRPRAAKQRSSRSGALPAASPAPTSTPTCSQIQAQDPFYLSCQNITLAPGQTFQQSWHCLNCTQANGNLTWYLNTGPWSPTACPNGMTCSWSPGISCWATDCYAILVVTAGSAMQPQTVVLQTDFTAQDGSASTNGYDIVTINPLEVLDTDITSGSQVVSGAYGYITVNPVTVGQQVKLQAVSAYGDTVSNLQWNFQQSAPTFVVSGYGLPSNTVSAVGTPSPVQTSGNPIPVYWLRSGTQYLHVTGTIQNQSYGVDVYYPITTPSVTVTATTSQYGVDLDPYYSSGGPLVQCPPPASSQVLAMALGDPCFPPHGIDWTYSLSNVPAYGAGQIAMAQVGQTTVSGTLNGKQVSASSGTTNRLDVGFPYLGVSVTTDATLSQSDSPGSNLTITKCTKVARTSTFVDYFMYLPTATSSRPGIWITMQSLSWGYTGNAALVKTAWTLTKAINPTLVYSSALGQSPTWPDGTLQTASYPC